MARRTKKRAPKKTTKKRGPGRPRKTEYEDEDDEESWFDLHPDTLRGIGIVVMLLLAVLSMLSLLDVAGSVGELIKDLLITLFGWGRVIIPFWFALVAYALLMPDSFAWRISNSIGLLLGVLGYSGLLHLFVDFNDATDAVKFGEGGGYAGLALSYPLQQLFGAWAAGAILVAILLIGLLLIFRTSLESLSSFGGFFTMIKEKFYALSDWIFGSDEDEEEEDDEEYEEYEDEAEEEEGDAKFASKEVRAGESKGGEQAALPIEQKKPKLRMRLSTDLLETNTSKPKSGDIESNKEKIRSTLDNFGISVDMGDVNVGPTVTQYTLKPHEGVKLSQILTLQNDLALALAAHPIRIEAPIPGKSLVGVEVPNVSISTVRMREILESKTFKKRKSNLSVTLGRDVAGHEMIVALETMPHLLIAGATGSGKSVAINSLIMSLLYQNAPEDLRLILVDPKRVEMTPYNDIPYLLTPVITDVKKTINALKWATSEMERRYELLSHAGKRNIASYNASKKNHMPYIVIIIDELADLMAVSSQEVEAAITRLAQMARAVGIHLVVATQRPSVDVITGLIKANITSRIAFTVASVVDSRTILDSSGAEKLLGRGDMLFVSAEHTKPKRIQGVFVSDDEISGVTDFLREQGTPEFDESVTENKKRGGDGSTVSTEDEDPLLEDAKEVVVEAGKASASFLQRRLRIGYSRAARLLDILEDQGIIGPPDGSRPREVLITQDILEKEQTAEFDAGVSPEEEPEEDEELEESDEDDATEDIDDEDLPEEDEDDTDEEYDDEDEGEDLPEDEEEGEDEEERKTQ